MGTTSPAPQLHSNTWQFLQPKCSSVPLLFLFLLRINKHCTHKKKKKLGARAMQRSCFPSSHPLLPVFPDIRPHNTTVLQRPPLHRAWPRGQTQALGWPRGTPHPGVPHLQLSGPDRAWKSVPGPGRPVDRGCPLRKARQRNASGLPSPPRNFNWQRCCKEVARICLACSITFKVFK